MTAPATSTPRGSLPAAGPLPDGEHNPGERLHGVGLAVAAHSAGDHFVATLVRSLAGPLIAQGLGLFTRMTTGDDGEDRILRHWARTDGIVGVAALGVHRGDRRLELLTSLGLPFAVVADAYTDGHPGVVIDVAAGTDAVVAFCEGGRHERTVYVSDPTPSVFRRSRATTIAARFEAAASDGTTRSAVAAALAAIDHGPATLLFDSDVHAAAALAALVERGLRVPEDAAVISWTDSSLCQSTTPSITAVNRRGADIGALLGTQLLAAVAGRPGPAVTAPDPFVVPRESS